MEAGGVAHFPSSCWGPSFELLGPLLVCGAGVRNAVAVGDWESAEEGVRRTSTFGGGKGCVPRKGALRSHVPCGMCAWAQDTPCLLQRTEVTYPCLVPRGPAIDYVAQAPATCLTRCAPAACLLPCATCRRSSP